MLVGRGERIRTSDLSVPNSPFALSPSTLTYYTVVFSPFFSPFRMVHFGLQCYALRFSVIPCTSLFNRKADPELLRPRKLAMRLLDNI